MLVGGGFLDATINPLRFLGGLVAVLYCMFGMVVRVVGPKATSAITTNVVRIGLRLWLHPVHQMSEVNVLLSRVSGNFFKEALYPMTIFRAPPMCSPDIIPV